MREFLSTVFIISILSGILESLTHQSVKNSTRALIGIVTFFLLLNPIRETFFGVDFSDMTLPTLPDSEISEEYSGYVREAFESGIAMAVADRFGLDESNIRVKVTGFDGQMMRAESIRISLSGVAALSDYRAIRDYINNMKIGECTVETDIG